MASAVEKSKAGKRETVSVLGVAFSVGNGQGGPPSECPLSTEVKEVREGGLWRLRTVFLTRETSAIVLEHWRNRMEASVAGTE